MSYIEKVKTFWVAHPFKAILIIALVLRILSALFSQGYGMHDDHFIAVEEPWSWTQDKDFDGWLPGTNPYRTTPSIYSFFYPGINYLQFEVMYALGIDNPKVQMFFIRLILALFSMLVVYYGYKITLKYSNEKNAKVAGLMLAVLWFMPSFAVRNLVEIVAIPILMGGTWMIMKTNYLDNNNKKYNTTFFIAGLIIGIALSVRFQTAIYLGGMGLALLFQKRVVQALLFGIGSLISFAIIQGIPDYLIWGEPFAVTKGYIQYNLTHKGAYGNHDNVLMYFQLLPGLLLPPLGALLFFGFFLKIKKHLLVFLPSLLFLLFHTYFPNRQERFIFTIIPMVVILGVIGWSQFTERSEWWIKRKKLNNVFYKIFWIINTIMLVFTTFSYSKKSRVECMHYFYKTGKEIKNIIIDDTGREECMMLPIFYSGSAINTTTIRTADTTQNSVPSTWSYFDFCENYNLYKSITPVYQMAEYVVFVENINLEERVNRVKEIFPNLEFETYIEPSLADKLLKKMNPENKNEDFYVYKTGL